MNSLESSRYLADQRPAFGPNSRPLGPGALRLQSRKHLSSKAALLGRNCISAIVEVLNREITYTAKRRTRTTTLHRSKCQDSRHGRELPRLAIYSRVEGRYKGPSLIWKQVPRIPVWPRGTSLPPQGFSV